jgi:putative copper export protein/mono/diheme cytochrome c family protein
LLWLTRLALSLFLAWLLLGGETGVASWHRARPGESENQSPVNAATSSTAVGWRDWAGLVACLGLILTASLTSHAAAEAAPLVPVLADFIHLVAVSAWAGGLAWFVLAVRAVRRLPASQQTGLVSALVVRFSALAAVGVGLVMVSGVYSSLLRVGTLAELTGTLYGKALLVKVALALLLMLLGAVNLLGISPRLRRIVAREEDDLNLVGRFRQVVSTELILSFVVLLCASLLTSLPPAMAAQSGGGLTASANADDLQLHLEITPGRVGINTFTLQVKKGGQPVTAVKEAMLRMAPRKARLPPTEAQLIAQGDGAYQVSGSYLSLPDTWQVQAIVRRDQEYDAYAIFQFNLQNPASPGQAQAEGARIAGGLAILCGLASGLALFGLLPVRRVTSRLAVSVPSGLFLLALGAVLVFKTPAPASEQLNPVSPSPQSIAAGQAIYTARCASCHGTTGKGDGPVGQTLIPRPADLTQHAVPGVHTDFQLYEWISDGIGGRMPSFKAVLSSTDRWNLVNFIRTLTPK